MNKDLKNKVLDKIHKKEIFMHPKIYFIARKVMIVVISLIALSLLVFSLSFVYFSIQASGEQYLLGFGINGILIFLKIFPWAIIIFTALLFFLFEWILRRFKFSYRMPMIVVFSYTLLVTIIASILVTLTPIHTTFLKRAEMNELPIIGGIYETIHDSQATHGIIRGNIESIQNNTLTISHNDKDKDTDDGTWNVIPPKDFNLSGLYVGEKIYIAGKINGTSIYAYGIHGFSIEK
jgi:glucan phosphoethanolaminetransferase (alkaline phosphatase superfamily)